MATEIVVDLMQSMPQLAGRCAHRTVARLALEDMHDLVDPLESEPGILGLAVPVRQCKRSTSATIMTSRKYIPSAIPSLRRTASTYIFRAICPARGEAVGVVLPRRSTDAMDL